MLKKTNLIFFLLAVFFSCTEDENLKEGENNNNPETYHEDPVGHSANDLLSAENFTGLKVEIVSVEGYEPTDGAVNSLKIFLENRLNKPQGVTVAKTTIASPGLAPYSVNDIREVEKDFRSVFNKDQSLSVFMFIADGAYSDNDNVLGVAYQNTSVALFGEKIHEITGGIGQPSRSLLESTVIRHEFGHIMGLVNVGTDMQTDHQDTEHGKHCDVDNCLMHWAVETGDVVDNLLGMSSPPELDSQCLDDLKANGGK